MPCAVGVAVADVVGPPLWPALPPAAIPQAAVGMFLSRPLEQSPLRAYLGLLWPPKHGFFCFLGAMPCEDLSSLGPGSNPCPLQALGA